MHPPPTPARPQSRTRPWPQLHHPPPAVELFDPDQRPAQSVAPKTLCFRSSSWIVPSALDAQPSSAGPVTIFPPTHLSLLALSPAPNRLRHVRTAAAETIPPACSRTTLLLGAMEARLLESLHHKLQALEDTVQACRRHCLQEFHQYYHVLLSDHPPSVAGNVSRTIGPSLDRYPALHPELPQFDSSVTNSIPEPCAGQAEPPVSPSQPLVDLHEREEELHGLFTPSYLPLLDSRTDPAQLPPPLCTPGLDTAAPAAVGAKDSALPDGSPRPGFEVADPGTQLLSTDPSDLDVETIAMGESADPDHSEKATSLSPTPGRPHPSRRSTDDTSSSGHSDKVTRRSALRRSNSASKDTASPRRVRFDFKGLEVFPTASPQGSEMPTPRPCSPLPLQEHSMLDSLLGVDDEEDLEPPPRKISSSDALRAMSRTPLDEGTVWTVVNPEADGSTFSPQSTPIRNQSVTQGSHSTPSAASPPNPRMSAVSSNQEQVDSDVEESDTSDEEFLSMAKPTNFTAKPPIRSSTRVPVIRDTSENQAPASLIDTREDHPFTEEVPLENEEDDLFHFEEGGSNASRRPRPRPLSLHDDVVNEDGSPLKERRLQPEPSASAVSPAVAISRWTPRPAPSTPTTARFQTGSLGSYKGRSVLMPIVRNPELLAQAESLGEFDTFVGGLDGRSGMDEGNLSSFRASLVQSGFSGTPRSLTERMMMEDAMQEAGSRDRS